MSSIYGSKGSRGGRPELIFYTPKFPQLGRGTSKISLTTTMIGRSTAAGEAGIMKDIIDGVREPPPYEKWSTEN